MLMVINIRTYLFATTSQFFRGGLMNNHILHNIIPRSLETAKYRVGQKVPVYFSDELCYAEITGITERGGELAYEAVVTRLQDQDNIRLDPGIETWIFSDQIVVMQ